ncbi:MipA/OmpV family protein [Corallincola luteus]|uniref:MipA/OmpV family protein n=1 Tax=Corallincola luteus TaxID=1775177 RepID=A0ABY2AP09_9GAMM|nr:MipA/OmpV family protein [Corallincola luteus]TCI04934.1 MipA/OmpV family protein [Corallincola luteus]
MLTRKKRLLATSGLMLIFSTPASAESLEVECVTSRPCQTESTQQPLWEIGLAGAIIYGPDYPAAGQSHTNQIVLPYLIYRGDVIRAGEDGLIKAQAFEDERWELDLSLDGSFNADSDDNDAREGMQDLDYLFGIGPELKYKIYRADDEQSKLDLKLQARAVFSTDFSNLNQRGYAFEPQLRYEYDNLFGREIRFVGTVGPVWGTEKLTDYFYQVDDKYVRPGREAYDANGGYMGTDVGFGLVFTLMEKRARLFLGGRVSFHQGAENEDSPLFIDETTYAVGMGFAYRLFASDKKASGG